VIRYTRQQLAARRRDDDGIGLLMVVLFLGVVMTLTLSISAVVLNNVQSTGRDRQAQNALSTAEGGVAQAVQVVRVNAPGYFTCQEPTAGASPSGACTTNPSGWTNSSSPETVSSDGTIGSCVSGLACYAVWISTLQPYDTVTHIVQYRIHSTGKSGGGPAARSLMVDIKATLANFPLGVYSDTISMNGTPGIHHESVYSLNCISGRDKINFDPVVSGTYNGYDWATDSPQSANSAANVTTGGCSSSIHTSTTPCNSTYPYDRDLAGGTLSTANVDKPCRLSWASPKNPGTKTSLASTSKYTVQDLYSAGYQPQGLTPSEYDSLKQQAQAMGTYNPANIHDALSAVRATTAVLYIDNADVNLGSNDIPNGPSPTPNFFRDDNTATNGGAPGGSLSACGLQSLIIVVRFHNLTMNSFNETGDLVTSIFVPEGTDHDGGNAQILGSVFAQTIDLRGTQDFHLDECFVNNPPSLLLDLQQVRYHEVDTQNIQ
jgi:hypothetical protein